ncbi:TRAP transporter large permease [Vallitalea okinawensis]|uniref:TRAP transporter large permease n=1 Tax=Vallitalea okinawensis TaxID=2078660 RepID=UPI000CFDA4D2|nr:TRAP transporter large permease [Vallitalea okinawensis]
MIAFLIFIVLVGLILLGVPIAVSLGITSIGAFIALGEGQNLLMMAQRMYSSTTGFTLLAIPFFILAGNLMNTGGITKKIFDFAESCVGHVWGGLGQVNILASVIFSGMSGAAVADAAGLGMIEIKAMTDSGYDKQFSAAITAASSTIGPVIPPSIPFVIYGAMTGVSVGSLFLAGFIPGILMAVTMCFAVYFVSRKRNYPRQEKKPLSIRLEAFKKAILPLMTPIIIIGGILSGWFTATEAAIIACIYAMILGGLVYKEIKLKDLIKILTNTVVHTVKVMFIISAAGFFGWLLTYLKIPEGIIRGLTSISDNKYIILLIIIMILVVLGCFLEGIAVLLITIPIFMPIILQLGVDPIQFGVIMILASMIGLLSPPVGMCLYAVASISDVKVGALSKEVLPYMLGIFLVLLSVAFIPQISLILPSIFG